MSAIYPVSTEDLDPVSELDDEEIAEVIISYRESGFTRIRAELEALGICHNKAAVKRVSEEVEAERIALTGVNPLDSKTSQEYDDALAAKATYIDPKIWRDCVLDKEEVVTFEDLRAKLVPMEGPIEIE